MPTLFFMPWTHTKNPGIVGDITVVQYARGKLPGTLGKIPQAALDAVLGNYADRSYHPREDSTQPVTDAVILRWPGDDEREDLLTPDEVQDRLQQTQMLVFGALSAREYGHSLDYCNADGLLVLAQHFSVADPSATSIRTRRRDGESSHMVSGSRSKPLFLRPMHASDRYSLTMDWRFAEALLALPDGELRTRTLDAAMLFNRANTDAAEVPPAAEIVFLRAALETLMQASHDSADLETKLVALMGPHLGPPKWHDQKIKAAKWKGRWGNADRPFTAWIRDFCHWRNVGAHGNTGPKKKSPAVWSLANHLMFGSWFVSRVVKCLMAAEGKYTLDQNDKDELEVVERFFAYDIQAVDPEGQQWAEVLQKVHYKELGRMLYAAMKP